MSEFERKLPSYRLAQTRHGEDLQALAARELGDANRWVEIAWINKLTPPYVTDSQSVAEQVDGVILAGSLIRIPAPASAVTPGSETGQVYERDCELHGKLLQIEDGDFSVVSGVDNLSQQLRHRINTPRGQLQRHPDYGCLIWVMKGTVNGPAAGVMGAQYVKGALMADYRVQRVTSVKADVSGDTVRISAHANAIAGDINIQSET